MKEAIAKKDESPAASPAHGSSDRREPLMPPSPSSRGAARRPRHNLAVLALAVLGLFVLVQRSLILHDSAEDVDTFIPAAPRQDAIEQVTGPVPVVNWHSSRTEIMYNWTGPYEGVHFDPLGFGGWDDLPPTPPRASLLSTFMLNGSAAAKAWQRERALARAEPNLSADPSACVIVTNYNNLEYINKTIADVLAQTFTGQMVVVVVDDYSTDGSRDIIREWAKADSRLIPVLLPGQSMGGTGIPSNIGLDICADQDPPLRYVAFVDGDDALERTYLEELVNLGEQHEAEVVIADFDLLARNGASANKAVSEMEGWEALPKSVVLDPKPLFEAFTKLMPAPWRKLLRLDYVSSFSLRFPEGDYFYEDNVLHWLVLLTAERVVLSPNVLVHHRTSRSLWDVHETKMGGFFTVMNVIGDAVVTRRLDTKHSGDVARAFIAFIDRLHWIIIRQRSSKMRKKFATCFGRVQQYWLPRLQALSPDGLLAFSEQQNAAMAAAEPNDLDLSIVVPLCNAAPFISLMFEEIDRISNVMVRHELFVINAASTDGSKSRIASRAKVRPHVYDIHMTYRQAAGYLRNLVIPLLEGRYVFFLDSDDVIDPVAMEQAVNAAMRFGVDVLMVPYQLEFITMQAMGRSGNRSEVSTLMGMDKYDRKTWLRMPEGEMTGQTRQAAMTLVNYPWNRLTRTQLLLDNSVYFGTTQVQNDVQYHWHALSAARRVAFMDANARPLCFHKKFVGTKRMQVTKMVGAARLEMFWAFQATHRMLCQLGDPFEDVTLDNTGAAVMTIQLWSKFLRNTTTWALLNRLVPREKQPEFRSKQAELLKCARTCSMRCLHQLWTASEERPSESLANPNPQKKN